MSPDFRDIFASFGIEDMTGLGVLAIVWLVAMLLASCVSILVYVLQSVGFYSIAKRRGIHNPWLAWIPIGNMWILGSISDQYQFVGKGRVKNLRKNLLGLQIAMTVIMTLFYVVCFAMGFSAGLNGAAADQLNIGMVVLMLILWLAMMVVAIVLTVFQFIACYNLFASCNPNNAALFLVLSIFFNMLLPFFIFAVRNKDLGMPPRRPQPQPVPWTPAPPPPAPQWQQPAAPVAEPVVEEPEQLSGDIDVTAEDEDFAE